VTVEQRFAELRLQRRWTIEAYVSYFGVTLFMDGHRIHEYQDTPALDAAIRNLEEVLAR
jgi:hypothetical protein